MIAVEPIGLLNTGLPVLVLVGVAILLPRLLVPRDLRSHARLAVAIGTTALVLVALGANAFGIAYALRGHAVGAALAENPTAVAVFFLRLAGLAALVWAPILALVWFVMAQRVERNRGEHLARTEDR